MKPFDMRELFGVAKPIIGMLHLQPLPGTPGAGGLDSLRKRLMQDAQALAEGGVDGLILENFGDAPYFPGRVPSHTVAYMTLLGREVRSSFPQPLGINVLRNDGLAALAVAAAVGASFIRVNVYMGARVADEGLIQGEAHCVVRYRQELGCDVRIFADVAVKHSASLGVMDLRTEVSDALGRGKADAVIVSGPATGRETDIEDIDIAKMAAGAAAVLVGSGVRADNIGEVLSRADGVIVGTGLKAGGDVGNAVDPARVRELMEMARRG